MPIPKTVFFQKQAFVFYALVSLVLLNRFCPKQNIFFLYYLIKKSLISTKNFSKKKLPYLKNLLPSKRFILANTNKLERTLFSATLKTVSFLLNSKKEIGLFYHRSYTINAPFFTLFPKTEVYSLTSLTLFYIFFKSHLNKKTLLLKPNVVNALSKLKLASLQINRSLSSALLTPKNSTTDLVAFQTLNDYFFAPSFYSNINKKSR